MDSNAEPKVFQFEDARDYLRDVFAVKQRRNPRYSMRSFAKSLGFKHHTMVSMILNKQRRLQSSLANRVADALELPDLERRFLNLMVAYNNAPNDADRAFYRGLLIELNPNHQFQSIALDTFKFLSEWYHSAILEMVHLPDFVAEPSIIASRLGASVNISEAKAAWDTLIRLKLVYQQEGRWVRTQERLVTDNDRAHQAIQNYHRQMLAKAIDCLRSDNLSEREFQGYSLACKTNDLNDAKQAIRDFVQTFAKKFECTHGGDCVYQLNINLVPIVPPSKNSGTTN